MDCAFFVIFKKSLPNLVSQRFSPLFSSRSVLDFTFFFFFRFVFHFELIFVYDAKYTAVAAKLLQSGLTLCDPIDGSPPGSSVPGILQARTLEWVAISFAWKWKVKVKLLSCVRVFTTPWTAAYQVPPSMGISRQEYWSGLPLPSLMQSIDKSLCFCIWIPNCIAPFVEESIIITPLIYFYSFCL